MSFSAADAGFMARALHLARHGLLTTTPNPRVGCVIVRDGRVLGEGWHERAGEPHAEPRALAHILGAGEAAQGATVYVTLEPCSHHGRTPPCADALVAAGVARVVAAMRDPNPLVAGQGLERLRAAGIAAEAGLLEAQAQELNIGFVARMTRGRPWLRLKVAASLDGKTALNNGVSQWITGPAARRDAHGWRAQSCAMLTGVGTVKDDNPRLTARDLPEGLVIRRQPRRVVVDSRLETPPAAAILAPEPLAPPTLLAYAVDHPERRAALHDAGAELICLPGANHKVDLAALLAELGRRGCNEVLAEAGTRLNGSLLKAQVVDELLIYQAPLLLGDAARGMFALGELTDLAGAIGLDVLERRVVGHDILTRARLRHGR